MPLKLNVGLMKKVGQPRYGSLCAACHLEIELECSLLQVDAAAFHDRVRRTFAACRRAVETELAVGERRGPDYRSAMIDAPAGVTEQDRGANPSQADIAAKNGGAAGDQGAAGVEAPFFPASANQLDYARRLASRIGRAAALRVEVLAQRRFGTPLSGLSRDEATRLILALRAVKAGKLDWATLFEESAA